MFKNSLYSFVRSSVKWSLGVIGLVVALLLSFYAKPSVSNVVIYNNTVDNMLITKEGDYYVPYVRTLNDKFVRGCDRYIDIQNTNGFNILDNGKLMAKGGNWFISVPAKNSVLVVTDDNMRAIRENPLSSTIDSSVKCIVGKKNGIWFKDMKVFLPINENINMISCRVNDGARKFDFMNDGEKYFCLTISNATVDMSGACIESIDFLKDMEIIRERAMFYNIYSAITNYLDFFIKSYGVLYGSLFMMLVMLVICSYDVYVKVRRSELNQNKAIEIDIAQRQFGNDPVRLNEALLSINNAYSDRDKGFLLYSFIFVIFEGYVQFGVIDDYCGVRGLMLGNNDLGLAEIVNFSNLFGILSKNSLYAFGPFAVVAAIIINTSVDQLSTSDNDDSVISGKLLLQVVFFVYMLSSKSVFFMLFYSSYSILKSLCAFILVKVRNRNPVKFVG